jgi:transposase-like protein
MVKTSRKSRLPEAIQRALITQFVAGVPARTAAAVLDLNRPTVTLYFHKLREVIAAHLAEEAPLPLGEVEVDESYFGGFQKGKRGRGAGGKVMVFGLLKRVGKVYVAMPSALVQRRWWALFDSVCSLIASSIRIAFLPTISLMFRNSIAIGSIIARALAMVLIISTGLRTSGTRQSGICVATTAFPKPIFTFS